MFRDDDGFIEYMGYRSMVVNDLIAKCVAEAECGGRWRDAIDDDLTEDELDYLEEQVMDRLGW